MTESRAGAEGVAVDKRWILISTITASGMVFLDGTIVNVAVARIGQELPSTILGTLEGQAYITSGYLAVLSAFLILAGALADKYGRRRIFLVGLAGFLATSVLAGLAPTMEFLVVARLLQGVAGALLVPGSLSIITAAFEGEERGRAFGLWAAATSGLLVFGPLIGGVLVDTISWRMAFLINVPFALLAIYGTWYHCPESKDPDAPRRLDWIGSIVIALAVGGIAFGLVRGQETGWSEPVAFVALGIGVVAAILFPILMVTLRHPLIPPAIFKRRQFTVINISTFLIYGALYVTQFLQFVFFQGVLGYTALAAALVVLPMGIILALGSTRAGSLSGRIGVWPFLVTGPILMALSQLWLARIPADSEAWLADVGDPATWFPPTSALIDILPASLLFGAGIMLVVAPLTTALMGSIPVANAGLGSAINNAISRVGQPLVLAILFVVISASFYGSLSSAAPDIDVDSAAVRADFQPLNPAPEDELEPVRAATATASTGAFHIAMFATALLLLAGAAVNGVGLERGAAGAREGQRAGRSDDASDVETPRRTEPDADTDAEADGSDRHADGEREEQVPGPGIA